MPPIASAEPTAEHARALGEDFRSNELLGGGWEQLPESKAVRSITEDGANPVQVRIWITLMAAMARARNADNLWSRGVTLWKEQPWAYAPERVAAGTVSELSAVLREGGVSQKYSQDANAWHWICRTLVSEELPSAIASAIQDGHGVARNLLEQVRWRSVDGHDLFPLLRGPKIRAMWVRQLAYPGDVLLHGLDEVPVAVDTHVKRVTEMLGLVPRAKLDDANRERIQRVWFDVASPASTFGAPDAIDGTAAGLDPALWGLGRSGCSTCAKARVRRPIEGARICGLCKLPP